MHGQKMQTEWQTVEALIRLFQEQSDLGLHCLLRPVFSNTDNFYMVHVLGNYKIWMLSSDLPYINC